MRIVLVVLLAIIACEKPASAPTTTRIATAPAHDATVTVGPPLAIEVIPAPHADSTVLSGNVGRWTEVAAAPKSTVKPLAVREEPAPGRTDSGGQIHGYCPPHARVFDLGGDRALVTREPCSGVTEISIREREGDRARERRVADSLLYGVVGEWRIVPLDRDRLLMISQGNVTNLQLVDLVKTRARWIRMPFEIEPARALVVGVSDRKVYVWGGSLQQAIGQTGCENPPPNQGCDPVAITKQVPNRKVWAWSLE